MSLQRPVAGRGGSRCPGSGEQRARAEGGDELEKTQVGPVGNLLAGED